MPAWRNVLRKHGSGIRRDRMKRPSWWAGVTILPTLIDDRSDRSRPTGWLIQRMRCADIATNNDRSIVGSPLAYARIVPPSYREDSPDGLSEDGRWFYTYTDQNTLW